MCLGIVMEVRNINGNEAIGEFYGVKKKLRVDLIEEIKEGDYVLVHAGFAISKLKEDEALEKMSYLKEVMELNK